jgi:hypothetical protein
MHKKHSSPIGLLREDIQNVANNNYRARQHIKKWLDDYNATDYPNRPVTRQYLEIKEKAKKLGIL